MISTRRFSAPSSTRQTITRAAIAAAVLFVLLGFTACGDSGGTTTSTGAGATGGAATTDGAAIQVVMKDMTFNPASLTIEAGETVTWTNEDSVTHDVVADGGEFKSENLATGDTFSFTFKQAGTYPYYCSIHPNMKGKVVVE